MVHEPNCCDCGNPMTGLEYYDDICDDCAKKEGLLETLDEEDESDG